MGDGRWDEFFKDFGSGDDFCFLGNDFCSMGQGRGIVFLKIWNPGIIFSYGGCFFHGG